MEKKKSATCQKRKKIVDKAWELFAKNGYKETKVEDITKDLGISKGSFYTYFATKDELLYEVLGKIKKEINRNLENINVNQVPEKVLEDYVKAKMNYVVKILNNMRLNSVEKFNSKNGNKYNADVISEFILISIEEFLYDEFVLKNFQKMKDDDLINIQNTRKVENSLKEIIKFINNALK